MDVLGEKLHNIAPVGSLDVRHVVVLFFNITAIGHHWLDETKVLISGESSILVSHIHVEKLTSEVSSATLRIEHPVRILFATVGAMH